MKKINETLLVIFAIALIIFAAQEKTPAQYKESNECSKKMAEETDKFIQDSKISFKGSRSEFYSNKDERIYVLSSDQKVNPNAVKPLKRIAAVIKYEAGNKNDGFYLVESDFQRDSINYRLTKNSEAIYTFPVKMLNYQIPGVPPPPNDPFCDKVNKDNLTFLSQLQNQANQTCTTTGACLRGCHNGQLDSYIVYRLTPQNTACGLSYNPNSQQLRKMFDLSVQSDSDLFTSTDKK